MKERLKHLRKKKGWTQSKTADLLGLKAHTSYANWEQGKSEPDHETLIRMSELFDVTIDYLLGKTDHPHESVEDQIDVEEVLNMLKNHNLTWDGKELDEQQKEKLISIIRTVLG